MVVTFVIAWRTLESSWYDPIERSCLMPSERKATCNHVQ